MNKHFSLADLRDSVSTTGHGLLTTLALPDTNGSTLDSILTTEGTGVGGVLSDFHLLYGLSERGTITGTVFTGDSDYKHSLALISVSLYCFEMSLYLSLCA